MLWIVYLIDGVTITDLRQFGVRPRELDGLLGILTYPLLHGDWKHLVDNSVPAFVLMLGMFSFYGRLGWLVLFWSWIMSGCWIWIAARSGNHIGFSGVIYALASFVFFSGIFRRYFRLMSLSLVVVFLYGSMIWGVFPIQPGVSWEGHLFGGIAGFILAYYFRDNGPQRPKYSWELEGEDENEPEPATAVPQNPSLPPQIRYIYREKPPTGSA